MAGSKEEDLKSPAENKELSLVFSLLDMLIITGFLWTWDQARFTQMAFCAPASELQVVVLATRAEAPLAGPAPAAK